jgi:hypothetical protein
LTVFKSLLEFLSHQKRRQEMPFQKNESCALMTLCEGHTQFSFLNQIRQNNGSYSGLGGTRSASYVDVDSAPKSRGNMAPSGAAFVERKKDSGLVLLQVINVIC